MSQIYKKILIVKRFGVKKIGENVTVKLNEAIKDLTLDANRPHPRPQSASPPTPLRMERGVITEIPLRVLRMLSNTSPSISRPVGVTSHTTPLSIRRGVGGEASVISVCRRRSVGSKLCVKRFC